VTAAPHPKPRIAFVFTKGRRLRVEEMSEVPSELFYGYAELARWGWDVDLLEESDLATLHRSTVGRAVARIVPLFLDMSPARVGAAALERKIARLNEYDVVVATNQPLGEELSVFASLGVLKRPLLMFVMGLLPLEPEGTGRAAVLRRILRKTTVVAISRGEQGALQRRLPGVDVRYVPFGVDHRFWTPDRPGHGGYVLSVGNDKHRDFPLLVKTWRPEWPTLRIITRLSIPPTPNVEVVKGDYVNHVLTDVEMRAHVQGALFTVIPVRDTWQPSGQSAALQAMACGIPLILSDTPGLWDRGVMRDGETCLLPASGDPDAMAAAIQRLIESAELRARLGVAARAAIEQSFTADLMATELGNVISERAHEAA
jgi:hypothetical protein